MRSSVELLYTRLLPLLCVVLANLPVAEASRAQVLRAGSELDYPPFALVDAQGHAQGFTIDLIKAVAREMDLELDIEVGPWSDIRAAFEAGQLELLPNMAISEERKRYAAFSIPHVVVQGAVFTRTDAPRIDSIEQLRGMRIIVMRGDIAHDYANERRLCMPECMTAPNIQEAMRLLGERRGDAVLAGRLMGLITLKHAGIKGIAPQALKLDGFTQKFSIAVAKTNTELLATINEGLALLKQRGIYDHIYQQWFGVYEISAGSELRPWLIRGALVLAAVLVLLVVLLQMQRALRRTVEARTAELCTLQEDYAHTLNSHMGMVLRLRQDGDGYVIAQGHGKLLERLGLSWDKVIAERLERAFPEAIAASLAGASERTRAAGTATVDCATPDTGLVFTASLRATELGVVATCMEISSRVRMEQELRNAVIAAEHASRSKSDFLAHVSHEVRTPLTGILGVSEMLLEGEIDPDVRRQVTTIHECSMALLHVLDDVLDLGKIESGTLMLEHREVNVRAELDELLRLFRPTSDRKKLALTGTVAEDVPPWLWLSAKHVRQTVTNLMSNSLKFTTHGSVSVHIDRDITDTGELVLVIRVADTGIGIPPDLLGKLFEPFSSAHRAGMAQERGSGLGLAICRRLCLMMSGSIAVESREHHGSIFTVRIPTRGCEAPERPAAESARAEDIPESFAGVRVLVAEDNPINQLIILHMFRSFGVEPRLVGDGEAAVHALADAAFDIAFLDVQMPGMDGLTAARAIRERESDRAARLPIIALTAHTMTQERIACLNSGMDDFLGKPIIRTRLGEILAKWAGKAHPASHSHAIPR